MIWLIVIAVLAGWLLLFALVLGAFRVMAVQEQRLSALSEQEAEAMTAPLGNVHLLERSDDLP